MPRDTIEIMREDEVDEEQALLIYYGEWRDELAEEEEEYEEGND